MKRAFILALAVVLLLALAVTLTLLVRTTGEMVCDPLVTCAHAPSQSWPLTPFPNDNPARIDGRR